MASPGSGLLNLYARGSNGDLWTRGWNGGSWSGWIDVGCCLTGDVENTVAAVSPGVNTVEAFEIGTDRALYSGVYSLTAGKWVASQFINHTVDYFSVAAAEWFPVAPPPPTPAPTTPPSPPNCGRPGLPLCVLPK